jgi:tRNA modification GTPase
MIENDTIAAVATPPGVGAVAIVRISGPDARQALERCFRPSSSREWRPQRLRRGAVLDAARARIDDALAVYFAAPHSYTGEDVAELHVHGGPGSVACVLEAVLAAGARLATPGEFTRRAFVNGRLDLAQAEAVADLIAAESRLASRAAALRLEGATGRALREMSDELMSHIAEIEAHVDYPEEVPEPDARAIAECVRRQSARVDDMLAGAGAAKALRDGIDCVIAGPPNAGKSSLLNALLEAERAIVSEIPGTTRDIVEDRVAVDGVLLRLRDTAGLRVTADVIEAEGVSRAQNAIAGAELVIVVLDCSRLLDDDARAALVITEGRARVVLANKLDLGDAGEAQLLHEYPHVARNGGACSFVRGSVKRRETVNEVRAAVAQLGWGGKVELANATHVANARQIEALVRARTALEQARVAIEAPYPIDIAAAELRAAVAAYGEITGATVTQGVLDGIFSRFCVGK